MQEPKVTDPPKATGQDMLEQQPKDFALGEGADLTLSLVLLGQCCIDSGGTNGPQKTPRLTPATKLARVGQ